MLAMEQGSNPQQPDHQSDAHPTEPPRLAIEMLQMSSHIKVMFSWRNKKKCEYCLAEKNAFNLIILSYEFIYCQEVIQFVMIFKKQMGTRYFITAPLPSVILFNILTINQVSA